MTMPFPSRLCTLAALVSLSAFPLASHADSDDAELCAQEAYAMGLRYQQQSAEAAALQRQGFAPPPTGLRIRLRRMVAATAWRSLPTWMKRC